MINEPVTTAGTSADCHGRVTDDAQAWAIQFSEKRTMEALPTPIESFARAMGLEPDALERLRGEGFIDLAD